MVHYALRVYYVSDELTSMSLRALDSIKAGKRQPEARYVVVKLAAARQPSVYDIFKPSGS